MYKINITARSGLLGVSFLFSLVAQAAPVFVSVGDAGNAPDTRINPFDTSTGMGAVAYAYSIGKYEVTNAEYARFLNAVAASADPYALYDTRMGSNVFGGITRSGAAGAYVYATKPGSENLAVNYVTFWSAARYANWLGTGNTETGVYALNGVLAPSDATMVRNGAAWVAGAYAVTSNDEWFKAAYYRGGSTNAGYHTYATCGEVIPVPAYAPSAGANLANYNLNGFPAIQSVRLPVGSFPGSPGPYGTLDQVGGVNEWVDAPLGGTRGVRGGAFSSWQPGEISSLATTAATNANATFGFRLSRFSLASRRAGTPAGVVGYDVAGAAPGSVCYVDFIARPRAGATDEHFVSADGARLGLLANGDGTASWRVYDGRLGRANGSGSWQTAGAPVPVGADGALAADARVTLRIDYATKRFDVLIAGALVAADLGLNDATVSGATAVDFVATGGGAVVAPDVLSVTQARPVGLPADADGDGMGDAWELARGLNPNDPSDRLADRDGDAVSNVVEAALASTPGYTGVPALLNTREISGVMVNEMWTGLPSTDVPWLRYQTRGFSKTPDQKRFVAGAATPANRADNYGQRIRGFITIPATGDYRFSVSGDDETELRLGFDGRAVGAVKVAGQTFWSGINEFTRRPGQQTEVYTLTAGQRIYVEAVSKDGTGADHLELGWLTPGATAYAPLPAAVVSSFTPTAGDLDNDGLPDSWEAENGLSPADNGSVLASNGPWGDPDGDGLNNAQEYALGRNPRVSDYNPAVATPGAWLMETWTGVNTATLAGLETATAGFTTAPSTKGLLAASYTEYNVADYFGRRLRAWITVPTTDDYVLAVSGAGECCVILGTDEAPTNSAQIASIIGGSTKPLEWTKYATQQAAARRLTAGKRYYIEARVQTTTGAEHLEVGYRLATESIGSVRPIPLAWLASYPVGATATPGPVGDNDSDSLPDAWELAYGLSSTDGGAANPNDGPLGDLDGDGLTNAEEFAYGWNPLVSEVPPPGGSPLLNTLLRQRWFPASGYASIDAFITATANFGTASALTVNLGAETLESGIYGERLRGWITPAVTGDYTFAVSGDNVARLRLSTDAKAGNAVTVAESTRWTYLRDFTSTYAGHSGVIHLTAGSRYYVELLHINGGTGHLSLAWRTDAAAPWVAVPAEVLSSFNRVADDGLVDTDDDGVSDTAELAAGTNPLVHN